METVIRPKKIFSIRDLEELWSYRELLYFFSWRDIKVRYKQTAIGILWALFQPLVTMIVFTVFFGMLAKMPSDGAPYPVFVYTGILFWQFFSAALVDASNCLITNQSIITKVYFPRLLLPVSVTITKLIDLAIGGVILGGLLVYYGYAPGLTALLLLPLLVLMSFMAAVGAGLFLAAVNVKYRDVRYILPFFIQILMFLTPVIYPASITGKYSKLLALNPMTGVIKSARAVLLGSEPLNWLLIGISGAACFIILMVGLAVFKRTERYFADIA